jgi:adenine deaminase
LACNHASQSIRKDKTMKLTEFMNVSKIANGESEFSDSLILIYTDSSDVRGPFVGENQQYDAYERACRTGRPFRFDTWNRLG